MTIHNDLFPETLVVTMIDGAPMTSSLQIAKHFDKPHYDVLKIIRKVVSRTTCPVRQGNFSLSSYLNEQNKKQPMYLLTRMGFEFIVSGFTGEEAEEWKWQFLMAFHSMEAQLHALTERKAAALEFLKPKWPPILHLTDEGKTNQQIADAVGYRHASSVPRAKRSMRAAGLPIQRKRA
jgi:Rha family phage regulatory protein